MSGDTEIIPYPERSDLSIARDPAQVVEEARRAAEVLKDVISKKEKPVMFNGQQYLEFEDWQTVAKFYGITAKVIDTKFIDYGNVRGFEAKAVALLVANGIEISAADAMCLNDEDNWSTRSEYSWENGKRVKVGERPVPLFQLRSMAQTRACAKALRNVLAWVVVLAGYRPTPAEELTADNSHEAQPQQQQPPSKPQGKVISENQAKRLWAICKSVGLQGDKYTAFVKAHGFESDREVTAAKYDEIVRKAQEYGHNNQSA